MNGLLFIDAAAFLFMIIGFHLAFRLKATKRFFAAIRKTPAEANRSVSDRAASLSDHDETASVFRMAGIMIMAFSFTAAAFANLIAYYTANPPN